MNMRHLTDGRKTVENAACALGWTSLGIGLTEVLAPDRLQSMMGLEQQASHRGILQVLGVREILHGISLLTAGRDEQKIQLGLWSRVVGDLLDGALLGIAATKTRRPAGFAAVAAMVVPVVIADMVFAAEGEKHRRSWF
jgi:hypothetical protein